MQAMSDTPKTPPVLEEIVRHTRSLVEAAKAGSTGHAERTDAPRGFIRSLVSRVEAGGVGVIAEVKRRSPSAGWMRPDYVPGPEGDAFDPAAIAEGYALSGASAISCLTDEKFFAGDPSFLARIRGAVDLPVLRKDFLIDPWQVPESFAMGADAVLLIAECLPGPLLDEMADAAVDLGMDVLLESHEPSNLERAVPIAEKHPGSVLLGVNNRDLTRMVTDMDHTRRATEIVPDPGRLVSESGIKTPADLEMLAQIGVRLVLVGESLMKTENPGAALAELLG